MQSAKNGVTYTFPSYGRVRVAHCVAIREERMKKQAYVAIMVCVGLCLCIGFVNCHPQSTGPSDGGTPDTPSTKQWGKADLSCTPPKNKAPMPKQATEYAKIINSSWNAGKTAQRTHPDVTGSFLLQVVVRVVSSAKTTHSHPAISTKGKPEAKTIIATIPASQKERPRQYAKKPARVMMAKEKLVMTIASKPGSQKQTVKQVARTPHPQHAKPTQTVNKT